MIINVVGTPAPQGSKRHVGNGVMIESSKKVKPWRQDVKYAALEALKDSQAFTTGGGVLVEITFFLARPKSHYRTGSNAHLIRDNAPSYPDRRPDLDKLIRCTLDGMGEAGVFGDDSQVVSLSAGKLYADLDGQRPGATILIEVAS